MHDAALATRVFTALADMKRCESLTELDDLAELMFRQLGYTSFGLVRFYAPDRTPALSVLAGRFDPSWSQRYIDRNYAGSSLIARYMLETQAPYSWSDAMTAQGEQAEQARIIGEANEHGLREGLFAPYRSTDRNFSALVIAGWDVPSADPLHRMMAEVFATHYSHEARRILRHLADEKPLLTPRQRDCLQWVRHGKSSTDIGDLLGISSETVEDHIAEACRKLGVRTRLQAAVEATLQGLLE